MLRSQHPGSTILYVGGLRTADLQSESTLFESSIAFWGQNPADQTAFLAQHAASYDLVVNVEQTAFSKVVAGLLAKPEAPVCGPCMGVGGRGDFPFEDTEQGRLWMDKEWIAPDIVQKYACLTSGFIGEIFCRAAYCEGPVPRYAVPRAPATQGADVLVAVSASLPDKLWSAENWVQVVDYCIARGLTVGLIGAKPSIGKNFWLGYEAEQAISESAAMDLRGTMSLPQVTNAIERARLVVTLDNGILHLAAATDTPTVGLFRYGIHRLWAPPTPNLTVLHAQEGRTVNSITLPAVQEAIDNAL